MTITTKLYFAFGLLIILSISYGGYSVYKTTSTTKEYESYHAVMKKNQLLSTLIEKVIEARLAATHHSSPAYADYAKEVEASTLQALAIMDEIAQYSADQTLQEALISVRSDTQLFLTDFKKIIALSQSIDEKTAAYLSDGTSIRTALTSLRLKTSQSGDMEALMFSSTLMEHFMLVRAYSQLYLATEVSSYAERAMTELEILSDKASQNTTSLPLSLRGSFAGLRPQFERYEANFQHLIEQMDLRRELDEASVVKAGERLQATIEMLITRSTDETDSTGDHILASMKASQNLTLAITIFAVLFNVAIATVFGQILKRRLNRISSATQSLAEGKRDVEIPDADKADEVGAIARALLVFRENLNKTKAMEIQQREQERLAEHQRKQALEELASKFESQVKGIVNTVASASAQLMHTAEQMSSNVQQSTTMAQHAAVAASQTSSNVQSVASAVEEMSASSREISSQTQRSTETVRESVKLTQDGDRSAAALQQAVERVQSAVDIINTIAGQINLLALNATIESARAGEAGRGFAVVAGEVKHLASQTGNATKEIANVLSEMNNASGDIIHVLSSIKSSITTVQDVAASIASAVEEQSATSSEISGNMSTASQGTQIISDNLGKVTEATLVSQNSSEQVLMASRELSRQAETLDSEINRFLAEVRGS